MSDAILPASLARPTPMRRALPLLLIVLLHLGLFVLLRNGLLQRPESVEPLGVITAMLFPPEPDAPATVVQPTVRPAVRVRPAVAKPAVVPRRPASALPAPASNAVAPLPAATVAVAPTPSAAIESAAPAPAIPATPAPPAAPAPVDAGPKTLSSGVQYLQPPRPDYPAQSKRLGEEGRVVLRVLVDRQGLAERIEVQKSSGFDRLDEAGRQAVQQARFKPHLEDGRPVAVFAIVPITFRLDQ